MPSDAKIAELPAARARLCRSRPRGSRIVAREKELMTERLYYTDPYLREFDAVVQSVEVIDGRRVVRLESTAFYPT